MDAAIPLSDNTAGSQTAVRSLPVPWYCYTIVLGCTSIAVGALWDISWHMSIGRDTFWTPAHMAIYFGGVLAGLSCGYLVLKSTFWPSREETDASVRFWGFRGPIGAWVTIWGALAMLTSAPFDDWWHNAYGLDVQILSPPHSVLALGIYAVAIGGLLLVSSVQNRTGLPVGRWLVVYMGGVKLVMASIWLTEYSFPRHQHEVRFFVASAISYPAILITVGRASQLRWPATAVAFFYMLLRCLMTWILPLFHAQPKLAPILNPVDYMVPPPFPFLMIVPALGIDFLLQRVRAGHCWKKDLAIVFGCATVFVLLFIPTQWLFSIFLLSPAANNWFFAGDRVWSYWVDTGPWTREFSWHEPVWHWENITRIWIFASASTAVGFLFGGWLSKVRR